jgi:hypothetical protein
MLRVSVHAGPLAEVSRFNLLAWLDIGYEMLAPIADYKVVLFQSGVGATPPYALASYPRWSASLWDLTARAIALGLNPDEPRETVPVVTHPRKGCAFASELSALIEHFPGGNSIRRRTLASASIRQVGRRRGSYEAHFDEHTMKRISTEPFQFTPDFMRPAELLLNACVVRLTGTQEMPPRPGLCVPNSLEFEGLSYVPIHQLVEPARTGFRNWLAEHSEPPMEHEGAPLGIAPEPLYVKFLRDVI